MSILSHADKFFFNNNLNIINFVLIFKSLIVYINQELGSALYIRLLSYCIMKNIFQISHNYDDVKFVIWKRKKIIISILILYIFLYIFLYILA